MKPPAFVLVRLQRGPSCRSTTVLEIIATPRIAWHKVRRSMERAHKPRWLFSMPLDGRLRVDGPSELMQLDPRRRSRPPGARA